MARICDRCGKSSVVGRSQRHKRGVAGKRWRKRVQATRRIFKPNLQIVTVKTNQGEQKLKLCAKCIKRLKKENKIRK
jgi:ribosomal protein L28